MPDVARTLPLPQELRSTGIERYGFHGLSCESIMRQLGDDPPDRLIIAHLGNGVSVTAVKGGHSVDTSMGLTPTGGVIMGTRSGDLDPGVLVYLARQKNFDATRLEALVDHRSGLLGISGIDSDMRRLHEASRSSADARLAIQMFCYSIRKQVAAMTAALDGIDLLVFTGGIGEHDANVRALILIGGGFGRRLEADGAVRAGISGKSNCTVRDRGIGHNLASTPKAASPCRHGPFRGMSAGLPRRSWHGLA
jgi:acetate kinase